MGRLRKELIWTLGLDRARSLLTRFGYAMGYGAAVGQRDAAENDAAWLAGAQAGLPSRGFAEILPVRIEFDRASGAFEYVAEILDSFEVVEHTGHMGSAAGSSACWILTGYMAGFSSAFIGGEVYFREERCAIQGGGPCRLAGRAADQWGPDTAAELSQPFEEENIGTELTVVYDELSRKNEELERAAGALRAEVERHERALIDLARSNAMLRAQQEATPDAILIVDLAGRVLSYNERFLKLWKIPRELASRGDDEALLSFVLSGLRDPESFMALVRHLYAHPLESREDDLIEFTDGTIITRATQPVFLPRDMAAAAPQARSDDVELPRGHETILLVDDLKMVRSLGRHLLESYGYTVLLAADGQEALDIYLRHSGEIRLVIMDLLMPRRAGHDAFTDLRALDPHLPVIVSSGYSAQATVERLLQSPRVAFLAKPYKPADLARMVREVLDGAGVSDPTRPPPAPV